MGDVVKGEFPIGRSCRAEAEERGCDPVTVHKERAGVELPPLVRGVNGRVYPSRWLSVDARLKRDKRIRQMLQLGWPESMIVERMHVSKGVVGRVAATTSKRRKPHKLSQRAWRDRLPKGE